VINALFQIENSYGLSHRTQRHDCVRVQSLVGVTGQNYSKHNAGKLDMSIDMEFHIDSGGDNIDIESFYRFRRVLIAPARN
jgi:hypothetical protein